MYEWLVGATAFFVIWLVFFIFNKKSRREMLWISFFTMFLGLTEPLFVPEYWNPPSLFDLAQKTGFDIESLIFAFSIGGIISVLYEIIFRKQKHKKIKEEHFWHWIAVTSPFFIFIILFLTLNINSIYSAIIAMLIGSIIVIICRVDLAKKMLVSGLLFLLFYFILVIFFDLAYPNYIEQVWNLQAISGILFIGVPLEELMFAFTAGMLWSSLYEHVKNYKVQ